MDHAPQPSAEHPPEHPHDGHPASHPDRPPAAYVRAARGIEFERVSFFTDAVYAIAMTLLVVDLSVPETAGGPGSDQTLGQALWAIRYDIFAFFLGFVLLGRYWLAHHRFIASLRSMDQQLISLNLVYLAFVAFMPFPIGLISDHEEAPVAFLVFAGSMAAISLLEIVMQRRALVGGHVHDAGPPGSARFDLLAAAAPVAVIVASLPIALWSTTAALLSWLALVPIGFWLQRLDPAFPARGRRRPRG